MKPSARTPCRLSPWPSPHGGLTLVEMVVAIAIISILMVSVTSAILIASRALPEADGPAARGLDAARVADQIAAELYSAVSVSLCSATTIEFTVERSGVTHTIRYEWSGTPGDPLIRQYDGGAAVTVLDNVQEFNLAYNCRTVEEEPADTEGPEELFIAQDSSNSGTQATCSIADNNWLAQYFMPSLPPDALSWRVTRVSFEAKPKSPKAQTLTVQVRTATTGGLPTTLVVDSVSVPEADLPTGSWHEVSFSNAGGLSPSQGCVIAFLGQGGGIAAQLSYGTGSVTTPGTYACTGDSLENWVMMPDWDVWLWVWGKVTTPGSGAPPSGAQLLSVEIALQAGSETWSRARTAALLLNQPEVGTEP